MNIDKLMNEIQFMSCGEIDLESNPEYQELEQEYDVLLAKVLEYLPKDKKDLWNKLENVIISMDRVNEKLVYHQGFKDGANIVINVVK